MSVALSVMATDTSPSGPAMSDPGTPDPEEFFARNTAFALDPDGRRIAWFRFESGEAWIVGRDLSSEKQWRIRLDTATYGAHGQGVIQWASKNRLVFQLDFGPVCAIDIDGSHPHTLFSRRQPSDLWSDLPVPGSWQVPLLLPSRLDGNPTALVWTSDQVEGHFEGPPARAENWQLRYYAIEEDGKSCRALEVLDLSYGYRPDPQGRLRLRERYSWDRVTYQVREPGTRNWRDLDDFVPAESAIAFSKTVREWVENPTFPIGFDVDPDILYFAALGKSGCTYLASLNLESRAIETIVTDGGRYDVVDAFARNSPLIQFPDAPGLLGVRLEQDEPMNLWFDAQMVRAQEFLDARLPGRHNDVQSFGGDGRVMLVRSWSSTDPGSWYVWDVAAKTLTLVERERPRLAEPLLAATVPMQYKAIDGTGIEAYLTLPAQGDSTKPPLVVLLHGGPWARDTYRFDPVVQLLAASGYAVFQPNFRGSSGYGQSLLLAGRGDFDRGPLKDVFSGIQALTASRLVDPDRVAVMGASYGGFLTMAALIEDPRLFRCGIPIAGVYDVKKHIRSREPVLGRTWARELYRVMIGDDDMAEAVSPLNRLQTVTAPVLVIHGEEDWVVDVKQSQTLVSGLRSRKKDVTALYLPREGHGGWSVSTEARIYSEVLQFLAKHLN